MMFVIKTFTIGASGSSKKPEAYRKKYSREKYMQVYAVYLGGLGQSEFWEV